MILDPKYNIDQQTFLEAKGFVERQWVSFFDFYRNCVFGFVKIADGRKGFFSHLIVHDDGFLEVYCNCRKATASRVCPHGFALFLKLINWPLEKSNLAERFEANHVTRLFKTIGRSLYREGHVDGNTNPALTLNEGVLDKRMLDYWGFTEHNKALALADNKALAKAITKMRNRQEINMLSKGMPSALIGFEESVFYRLAKLLFALNLQSELDLSISAGEDHQAELQIKHEGAPIFTWRIPVHTYIKGIRPDWDFWKEKTRFEIRRQGVPLTYRIQFGSENDLEVEPMVSIGIDQHIPVSQLETAGASNLFHHPLLGYFHIQTGLSPFEMEYGNGGVTTIGHQGVSRFLKQHRDTLETLDRDLIDEAIFGEVVIDRFDSFVLELIDHKDYQFTYQLEAKLGGVTYNRDELTDIFKARGRYRKLGGKLFDTAGYDGAYLHMLFEEESDTLPMGRLFSLLSLFKERLEVNTTELTATIYQHLKDFKAPDAPNLQNTDLNLRPYQESGYQWLYFLKTFGLGGLLCDQMGLGKTHQGMALLAAVLAENQDARVLVIAPTSVLYHWKDKLKMFCPEFRAHIHHGPDRDIDDALETQVLITSYGTLRNDIESFHKNAFNLVIYDEIQYLKNKGTKVHRAIAGLSAFCRVGLTGTPIENDLSELKALFDLVFPGYLGADNYFRKFFADPIQKFDSQHARHKLRDMIKPFILRRSKSEVLTDLPEKTEDMRQYNLSKYERDLYKQTRMVGQKKIHEGDGNPVFLHIFRLIDNLKQISNHPALFFKNDMYEAYPSTKWDIFKELLQEALDSGEKVVVFTQYLGMIDIFKKYLRRHNVEFACITGQTTERHKQQQRFMEDPDCRVFLGTIMAAGVGIDLTSASIVIHYDRWWNPAREDQATDRIHRIGQKKNVQVYKFTGIETVEERIDGIISRKRELLENLVEFDSAVAAKSLSVNELLEILA